MTVLKLANRLNSIAESSTLKMNAAARALSNQGVKVLNLTAGEPDFAPFGPIKKATVQAVEQDFNKYTPVPGLPELRKAIAEKLNRENGLAYKAEEVCVTMGGKQAIFNFFLSVLNEGDEVIIPAPYWVSYPEMVKIIGGTPVILPTTRETRFKVTPDALKKAITKKTKAFVLNSPSNPTGMMYSKAEQEALAKVLQGTDIWVVSDEIYEKLVYEGQFVSFASLSKDAFARTLTTNGFSKSYALTGWRAGYAAGPKALIDAMAMLQGQSTSGAASIVQKGALAALHVSNSEIEKEVVSLRKRRNLMCEVLRNAEEAKFLTPDGAFYVFVDVSSYLNRSPGLTSDDFALRLLQNDHVGTVPGAGFGAEGYLRLSFAVSEAEVREGTERLVAALKRL